MRFGPAPNLGAALFFILAGKLGAQANSCTVDPPTPILRPEAVQEGTYQFRRLPPLPDTAPEASERALLPSGTHVVIKSGGCAHWGELYSFEVSSASANSCTDWLRKAVGHLDEVAKAAVSPAIQRRYRELLAHRAVQQPPYPCEETIPMVVDAPDYGSLTVSTTSLQNQKVQLDVRISLNPQHLDELSGVRCWRMGCKHV